MHWEFLSWGVEFTLGRRLGGVNGGLDVALDAVGRRGRLITLHIVPTSDKELQWFRFREYSSRKGAPSSRCDERLDYKGLQSLTGRSPRSKKRADAASQIEIPASTQRLVDPTLPKFHLMSVPPRVERKVRLPLLLSFS